jgi:hypothetical protein
MDIGTGDGLGSSSYASEICAALAFPPPTDEDWNSLGNLDLPPLNMDSRLSPSPLRQYGGQASGNYSGISRLISKPPEGRFLSSRPINGNHDTRSQFRQPAPSYGGPRGNGNYGAATTSNLEHRQYIQHSSLNTPAPVDTDFSFSNYQLTEEGWRHAKQPQDNGKDREAAADRRPAPTRGRASVKKTNTTPPDAFLTGSEINHGDPCLEQQAVVGAKGPAQLQSLSKRRKKATDNHHKDVNEVRSRLKNVDASEDQILLSAKIMYSTLGISKMSGGSWSSYASEMLEKNGFKRCKTACEQRWDTLLKRWTSNQDVAKEKGPQPPPAGFKNLAVYHLMEAVMNVQSPENDTCGSGQTVDASAQLSSLHNKAPECSAGPSQTNGLCPLDREVDISAKPFGHGLLPSDIFAIVQETQVPIVSSHDPHMLETIRRVVLPAIQEMEENMKSSQNDWMAAISDRLEVYWQEVKTIKESLTVGEYLNWGGSQTKVVADVVASTGEEHAYLPNQDASPSGTYRSKLPGLDDVRIGKSTT